MILPRELEKFAVQIEAHLFGHILPFWCGPALDITNGGWMAWLSNDLKPDRSQPKGLIVNARILWTFSAVHRSKANPLYQQMADRAFDFVMDKFWDARDGGAFWRLTDAGEVMDDSKKIYGQAFYIYALTEFYRAFGSQVALQRAKELFELIERHAHDEKFGGYLEVCRRDWSEAGVEARLSDKDMAEVERDVQEAKDAGIQGVPLYIFGGRFAVSGAQAPEYLAEAIARTAEVEAVE